MKTSTVCKGMAAFAVLPAMAIGIAHPAFAAEDDGVPGTSVTNDMGDRSITKSTDLDTLPKIGETIRYSILANWTATLPGGESVIQGSFVDNFDPAQLRFIEARVEVEVDFLIGQRDSRVWQITQGTGIAEAESWLHDQIAAHPGDWDQPTIDAVYQESSDIIAGLWDEYNQAIEDGDDVLANQINARINSWYNVGSYVQNVSWSGMSSLDGFFDYAASVRESAAQAQIEYDRYDNWITLADGAETTFIVMDAEVGDGTVELTFPGGGYFPGSSANIQYDMEFLGGTEVMNQACFGESIAVNPTEPTFMREGWTPPEVADDIIAPAAIDPEAEGCAILPLVAPETTVHVVKRVMNVGEDEFSIADGWVFGVELPDYQSDGETHGTGYEWLVTDSTEDRDVTLLEVSAPNALLDDYNLVSVECTVDGEPIAATVNNADRSVLVPQVPAGGALSCGFNNAQIPGTVTWEKVDAETEKLIAGAIFELTGDDGTTLVEDCITDPCTLADQDARPGSFSLTGLPWGEYTLTEVKAPSGYILGEDERTVTIGSGATTVDAGVFENEKKPVTPGGGDQTDGTDPKPNPNPNAGGGGKDGDLAYTGAELSPWVLGGSFAAIAIGAALTLIRRRRSTEQS